MGVTSCYVCSVPVYKSPKDWMNQAYRCYACQQTVCIQHTRSYVDGSNEAITNNSPKYCRPCFYTIHDTYGDLIIRRRGSHE